MPTVQRPEESHTTAAGKTMPSSTRAYIRSSCSLSESANKKAMNTPCPKQEDQNGAFNNAIELSRRRESPQGEDNLKDAPIKRYGGG